MLKTLLDKLTARMRATSLELDRATLQAITEHRVLIFHDEAGNTALLLADALEVAEADALITPTTPHAFLTDVVAYTNEVLVQHKGKAPIVDEAIYLNTEFAARLQPAN